MCRPLRKAHLHPLVETLSEYIEKREIYGVTSDGRKSFALGRQECLTEHPGVSSRTRWPSPRVYSVSNTGHWDQADRPESLNSFHGPIWTIVRGILLIHHDARMRLYKAETEIVVILMLLEGSQRETSPSPREFCQCPSPLWQPIQDVTRRPCTQKNSFLSLRAVVSL